MIEVLVVITIIGVLVALMLPAIQSSREIARRMRCQASERQLGHAFHLYEAAHKEFPPGYSTVPFRHNYVQHLLPYLERSQAVNDYSFTHHWSDASNRRSVDDSIRMLECPSAPAERQWVSDYAVCVRIHASVWTRLVSQKLIAERTGYDGFLRNKPVRLSMATDGSATTLLICEDAGRPRHFELGRFKSMDEISGARWATPASRFDIHTICDGQRVGIGSRFLNCTNNNEIYGFHPTGVNLLFVDGSVRFISQQTDANIVVSFLTATAND